MVVDLTETTEIASLLKRARKAFPNYHKEMIDGIIKMRDSTNADDHLDPAVAERLDELMHEVMTAIASLVIFADKQKFDKTEQMLPLQIFVIASICLGHLGQYEAARDNIKSDMNGTANNLLKQVGASLTLLRLASEMDRIQDEMSIAFHGLVGNIQKELVRRIAQECGINIRS